MASDKSPSTITLVNANSWFINEYHVHAVIPILLFLFNRIFFYLCAVCSVAFYLPFLCINPILFSGFLTLLSQTLTYLIFNLFCCTFSMPYCFGFSILTLSCRMFPFLTAPFHLYLPEILDTTFFVIIYNMSSFWMSFTILFITRYLIYCNCHKKKRMLVIS